ncbi:hypothetical protein [Streptomyces olivaceiscleroticus]|uniref:Uncharacterized protein n=1 Tax=Streptomyces olivaceiscleroticus TaxID=68245 RepID=A0ABP3JG05_9ACTN
MNSLDGTPDPGCPSSARTPNSAIPGIAEPRPAGPDRPPTAALPPALWPVLLLLLGRVVLLFGAALLYLTWQHPGLATPATVAIAGVMLLLTVVALVLRR